MRKFTLLSVAALMLFALSASAGQITGGATGLTGSYSTVTFDELGNLQGQTITNQFASYGVTLNPGFYWDNSTRGQTGSTGFSGGDVVTNGAPGPYDIIFNGPVNQAAFAAVDQNGNYTIQAYLGGTLVDSFNVTIPFNPGIGYIGFSDEQFDRIHIVNLSGTGLAVDNVEYTAPEPATFVLFGTGLAGIASMFRRKLRNKRS